MASECTLKSVYPLAIPGRRVLLSEWILMSPVYGPSNTVTTLTNEGLQLILLMSTMHFGIDQVVIYLGQGICHICEFDLLI